MATIHRPERYELHLVDGDDDGWREVTESEWRDCAPGARVHYPACTR